MFMLMRGVSAACVALAGTVFLLAGCDKSESSQTPNTTATSSQIQAGGEQKAPLIQKKAAADWCREHGVPESVCMRCNASLVAGFKADGDWCTEHGVPESQCFICHPELKAQFAAQYRAKYGKEPPTTQPET